MVGRHLRTVLETEVVQILREPLKFFWREKLLRWVVWPSSRCFGLSKSFRPLVGPAFTNVLLTSIENLAELFHDLRIDCAIFN